MEKWAVYLKGETVCMGPVKTTKGIYVTWSKFYSIFCIRSPNLFHIGSENGADIPHVKVLNKKQAIKLAFLYNKDLLDECVKHREDYFKKMLDK